MMKKLKRSLGFIADIITVSSSVPWILIAGGVVTVVISFILQNGWILIIGLLFLSNVLTFILFWKQKSLLNKPLIIGSAKWDAEGPKPKDVTQIVRSLVTEGTLKLEKGRYNQIFGDTACGVPGKKCHVSYYLQHEVTTDENEDLILPPDKVHDKV